MVIKSIVEMKAKPGRSDELLSTLHQLQASAGGAPGFVGAQHCRHIRDEDTVIGIYDWQSEEQRLAWSQSQDPVLREQLAESLATPMRVVRGDVLAEAVGDDGETAFLAGGCAWIMQPLLSMPPGVLSSRIGWMGGEGENPTEENDGGHAETVKVVFDPARLSYRGLLEVFFQTHRADLGQDVVGSIYRSEIFFTTQEQRRVAEEMIRDVDASGHWLGRTVTRISPAGDFWEQGSEQQDYLRRFPDVFRAPFPRQVAT